MPCWDDLVELLKGHDEVLSQAVAPQDERLRAELMRQFVMNLSQGYFLHFHADPAYPEFVPFEVDGGKAADSVRFSTNDTDHRRLRESFFHLSGEGR